MNLARRAKPKPFTIERRPLGPTPERIAKSDGYFEVGDDQQGGRVYTFRDSTMDRLYSRLTKAAKTCGEEDELRREYTALMKYKHHWYAAGLLSAIGSVDLNRVFASDPGSMSGMAKTESQAHHRKQYREAQTLVGHQWGIILDNVVCYGNDLVESGYGIGFKSPYRARKSSVEILRASAEKLARHWGIG